MTAKELKIMQVESRIAKLSVNRVENQNIINKNMRILRKLKESN